MLHDLHEHIAQQMIKRRYRHDYAVFKRNTTQQWDLIAAAFEEACIEYFGLTKTQATKAKGRARAQFANRKKNRRMRKNAQPQI